jgi:hypothetical protein
MATISSDLSGAANARRLNPERLAISAGLTAGVVFLLCWVGTFLPFSSPTHVYISLFTSADVGSVPALLGGGLWSVLFGVLVGTIFALVYNASSALSRR